MKSRRLTAIAALALLGAGVFVLVLTGTRAFPRWLIAASLLVGALIVEWNALRRRGAARALFATVAIVLLVTFVGVLVAGGVLLEAIVAAALFSSAAAAARQAFRIHVPLPRAVAPTRPVVVWNPKSGGGKALAANLDAEARARGIEPIELKPGDDLLQLVRDAVADGADALAAAGGDGTQALVATIAAEVNGRVFVNNVSLGLYAEAVQRSGYRNAKIRTVLDTIPDFSDATGDGHVLEYTGPGGVSGRRADLERRSRAGPVPTVAGADVRGGLRRRGPRRHRRRGARARPAPALLDPSGSPPCPDRPAASRRLTLCGGSERPRRRRSQAAPYRPHRLTGQAGRSARKQHRREPLVAIAVEEQPWLAVERLGHLHATGEVVSTQVEVVRLPVADAHESHAALRPAITEAGMNAVSDNDFPGAGSISPARFSAWRA